MCLIHMHAIGVSNPNVPIFPPRVCTLVLFIIIVIFAANASFTYKLRRHLLALMALTTPKPQNTDTNGIHATWA